MKPKIWNVIVFAILALAVISYENNFTEIKPSPTLWNIPFILWSSFLVTLLVVSLTYLRFVLFPQKEIEKSFVEKMGED
jgi:hypothetical protein